MNIPWQILATIIFGMTMINAQVKTDETKIRVLLTTGGHGFEEKLQVASIIAQENSGGIILHKRIRAAMVSRELILLLKSCSLSQPMMPTESRGAGRSGMGLNIYSSLSASDDIVIITCQ